MPDPTPDPKQGNAGEGNQPARAAVEWSQHIPKELATEKLWEPLKDKPLGDVLKGYAEAQKFIGGSVRLPKEDAPPEEWAKFHQKLGTPEKPDGYQFKRPALGEGAAWDKDFETRFLTEAHSMGLNSKQVQKLMDLQAGLVEQQLQGLAAKRQETVTALKKEWGGDFERKMGLAGRAKAKLQEMARLSEEDAAAFFDGSGAGDHPVLLKIFHQLGEIFAEDGWIKGETGAAMVQNIQTQIDTIRKNPEDPYNLKGHPEHDKRVDFVNKLYERMYPQNT